MNITDSDIIFAARDLRDEQNAILNVASTPLKRRSAPTSLWWATIAAAVIIAFFMGKNLTPSPSPVGEGSTHLQELAQSQSSDKNTPIAPRRGDEGEAIHDTIYMTRIVRVPVASQPIHTAQVSSHSSQPFDIEPQPKNNSASQVEESSSPCCSMLCDDIRYDLLADN